MTTVSAYGRGGKRLVDVVVSGVTLILVSPLLVVTAAVSRFRQGKPVLFSQTRAGRGGQPFVLWKFRTMRGPDHGGTDDDRLTAWGRLLRHSSIDELPQLFNVLIGDMSLVGPRPLYLHYIPRYSVEQAERLSVRPGLTGLAQVSGRNLLDWEARLRLDTRYARSLSLRLDASIVVRTVVLLVGRSSTAASSAETPAEFVGAARPNTDQEEPR